MFEQAKYQFPWYGEIDVVALEKLCGPDSNQARPRLEHELQNHRRCFRLLPRVRKDWRRSKLTQAAAFLELDVRGAKIKRLMFAEARMQQRPAIQDIFAAWQIGVFVQRQRLRYCLNE